MTIQTAGQFAGTEARPIDSFLFFFAAALWRKCLSEARQSLGSLVQLFEVVFGLALVRMLSDEIVFSQNLMGGAMARFKQSSRKR